MLIMKDELRQQIISDFLCELDHFEQTAERTLDRNELDPIESKLKELLQQLNDITVNTSKRRSKSL